jgi:hypothetical protein
MVVDAAVSYTAKDASKPALGSIKLEANTSVAIDERLVNITDAKITESNFPSLSSRSAEGRCRRTEQAQRQHLPINLEMNV